MSFKARIQKRLEKSVKKYFKKHPDVRLVAVVGSVGKTSTKIAIGTVLNEKYRIRLHEGNHNSELSAPLAILGIEYPDNIRSLKEWWRVFRAISKRIRQPSDVDVIVQELGTDGIGQMPHFGTYLSPDIVVVTSVAPEHMEFFKTMDAVAAEELSAVNFSKSALINRDDVAGTYANYLQNAVINAFEELKINPTSGSNIKKLVSKNKNLYRYRIRSHRLVYQVNSNELIILALAFAPRGDVYKHI